ncbi:MAG: formylglycine-generating enzyme family protein [Bacteroidota bacterium]|nr:formylglycine-generating enzyme family protein [Bacteroidota bacterium]
MILIIFLLLCIAQSAAAQDRTLTNDLGMEFVLIHPGAMIVGKFKPPYPVPDDTVKGKPHLLTMWMGDGRSYNTEEFRLAREMAQGDARPGFEVVIDKPYFIGKYEVTQAQWQKVMGKNPSVFQVEDRNTEAYPVENVTWEEVQEFLRKLNERDPARKYRLPTEFEWEYAARAGDEGDIPWSETEKVAQLGGRSTYQVGQKKPNAWGLYDMLGNVWEWVHDYYNEKLFADPRPPIDGKVHVLKGASFAGDVKNATWLTHAAGPGNGWDVGFRVVLEVNGNP